VPLIVEVSWIRPSVDPNNPSAATGEKTASAAWVSDLANSLFMFDLQND